MAAVPRSHAQAPSPPHDGSFPNCLYVFRNDFQFNEKDLEKVRSIILKHRDILKDEIEEISAGDIPTNYQVSVFGFRV